MDDPRQLPQSIDARDFTVVKRGGYDQREVKVYLEDLEQAFRDLELWAQRTKDRLVHAELEAGRARNVEERSMENAMSAVFDAKDRILERAHQQADQIESRAKSAAVLGGAGVTIDERVEVERLRLQAEQMLADAERRGEAIVEAAERRLTDARKVSAEADQALADARAMLGSVDAEESTWAAAAQQDHVVDLERRLELAHEEMAELRNSVTPDQAAIDRANEEAEAIIIAAQRRSAELIQQAQAAMTMPGGEAIANAEERASSLVAEAEARARQIEEAALGVKQQAEAEAQSVSGEASRLRAEAEQARVAADESAGRLASAQASYEGAKAEVDDLRQQLGRARTEIESARTTVFEAPSYPPAPPVTADDAADGIVTMPPGSDLAAGVESVGLLPAGSPEDVAEPEVGDGTFSLADVGVPEPDMTDAAPPDDLASTEIEPAAAEEADEPSEREPGSYKRETPVEPDDVEPALTGPDGELSASERLRLEAKRVRRESGLGDGDAPMAGRGSRYERRSAGLPRIGAGSDFGGLRSRLAGDGSDTTDEDSDAADQELAE